MAMATLVSDASASSVTRPGFAATVSQMNIAADSCTGCPCTGVHDMASVGGASAFERRSVTRAECRQ